MKRTKEQWEVHILSWMGSWIDIVVALINIFTLGFYRPLWVFRYFSWNRARILKNREQRKV